jgi:hypothetical protein
MSCDSPLQLTLEPGQHFPGAQPGAVPGDLPPGSVALDLPLYPDATPTQEQQKQPSFMVPADLYMKSASAMYAAPGNPGPIMSWYQDAFRACGYADQGTQTSGQNGVQLSQGFEVTRKDGRDTYDISLSFAAAQDGRTLILYVAIALTPPDYPVAGSILRVPGVVTGVTITRYSGMNPGPRALRPLRTVDVQDAATAAALADEINYLPKLTGVSMSCPQDDASHITLLFRDADGSTRPVYVGLRGCQLVRAPEAPAGRLYDDAKLLPRLEALLQGTGSRSVKYPFDAASLRLSRVRQLGGLPGRFLSTGQCGSNLLYISRGDLFIAPAAGGTPRLLARRIADAGFSINDRLAVARPAASRDLTDLRLIDTKARTTTRFGLPRGAQLIGRTAGASSPGLSDAAACNLQYIFFVDGRSLGGIDPLHPTHDRFTSAPFLPSPVRGQRMAISCSGVWLASYQPGHGLLISNVGRQQAAGGDPFRRLAVRDLSFLSWAPDDQHLAYRAGASVSVLDIHTGKVHEVLHVGRDHIHGAAWDPWSHVLALSVSSPAASPTSSRIVLANVGGRATGELKLPFMGAARLDWAVWKGETIGMTRMTARGTEAWAVSVPALPADPGMFVGG